MGTLIRGAGGPDRTGRSIVPGRVPSFSLRLISSLVPEIWSGSNVPTFTRASTAYVFGYTPTAVLGTDSPIAILVDSGEARFMGARRISAGVYSAVDANGTPLTTATPYTDAGGPFGYLSEGARADVLGTTAAIRRTMTDVGWVVGATMTVGSATGVDGVALAGASLTGGAVTATNTILFTTVLGAAVRTYSAWVRRKTGTGVVSITGDGGVTWTPMTLTTAYKNFAFTTASAANPVVGFKIDTNADAIEVDFNTLEAATFANPTPIPINVSKAADVLTYPSAGNINASVGSIYAEITKPAVSGLYFFGETYATGGAGMGYVDQGGGNDTWGFYDSTGTIRYFTVGAASSAFTTPAKHAMSYGGTSTTGAINGVLKNTVATASPPLLLSASFIVGDHRASGNTSPLFGTIRNLKLYPVALYQSELVGMTT